MRWQPWKGFYRSSRARLAPTVNHRNSPHEGRRYAAAKDPDTEVGSWLSDGAPAGFLRALHDPCIFPDCEAGSLHRPKKLHCDEHVFRNYSGVEEERTIEEEMQNHLDKGQLAAFDTYELLKEFVGGEPILN